MGGLARRAGVIDSFRGPEQGLIVVDVGDSLATLPGVLNADPQGFRPNAETILQAMGVMGADALVPGESELALGLPWLAQQAGFANVPLLAANLTPRSGKPLLSAGRVVETGGLKVGLFGLSDPGEEAKDRDALLQRTSQKLQDLRRTARAQVGSLSGQGARFIILLAHMKLEQAEALVKEVAGIHLVILGHTGLRLAEPRRAGTTFLVEAGRRGREVGHVAIILGEGWKADAALDDDSAAFGLYDKITRDLAALKKDLARPNAQQFEAEMRGQAERLESLITQYKKTPHQKVDNLLASTIIQLDDTCPESPAVRALLSAKQQAREQAPMVQPAPAPAGPNIGTPIRIPPQAVREAQERQRQQAHPAPLP